VKYDKGFMTSTHNSLLLLFADHILVAYIEITL